MWKKPCLYFVSDQWPCLYGNLYIVGTHLCLVYHAWRPAIINTMKIAFSYMLVHFLKDCGAKGYSK